MSIAGIHQGTIRSTFNAGFIGTPVFEINPFDVVNGNNVMGMVYDTWTLTRSSANATYGPVTYTDPDGIAYSYTYTVTGSTTADDSSDAKALFAQEDEITAWYDVSVASNVVTMTARNRGAGAVGVFADSDSNLTTANSVAGADGSNIPAGRIVFQSGLSTQPGMRNQRKVVLPSGRANSGTALVAQVVTDTFAGSIGAGDEIQTRYYVPALGVYSDWIRSEHNTDLATTLAAHVVLLNAELDTLFGAGSGITAAVASSTITHTADVAGFAFSVQTFVVQTASGTLTVSQADTTGAIGNPATDAMATILGLSLREGCIPSADGVDDAVIKPGKTVAVAKKGVFRVASAESWTDGAQLYVSVASGATDGRLYTTASSTRLPLPKSMVRAAGYESGSVGLVAINIP